MIDTSVTVTARSLGTHKRSVATQTQTIGLATHQLILKDTGNDDAYRISIGVDNTLDSNGFKVLVRRPDRSYAGNGKGTDLLVCSQAHLHKRARQLNERPRKTLEFESAAEIFNACIASIG